MESFIGHGQASTIIKILQESKFKNIWIQPAAGDAGGALGAAIFVWYGYLNNPRVVDGVHDLQNGSYLGPQVKEDEVEEFVKESGAVCEKLPNEQLPKRVAEILNSQKVVGLFQGRMEFGPRALGARSIIGDARSVEMQSVLNLKIKFRESFRPFAPSILADRVEEYFDLNRESPYMLLVAPVNEDKIVIESRNIGAEGLQRLKIKKSSVPAITHVDYSARIQTVSRKTAPLYYDIIQEFDKLTGCPVIINTSFNIRGEPIVCTPQDAYRCFMCTNLDYLFIENYLFDKTKQPNQSNYKKEDIVQELD